jgi:hypothetical protein
VVPYTEIEHGSWSSRWGDWMIFLKETKVGWAVVVWMLPIGTPMAKRKRIGSATALDSAADAVAYACDVLRRIGVRLLVSGAPQRLEKFLSFSRAPQEVQ